MTTYLNDSGYSDLKRWVWGLYAFSAIAGASLPIPTFREQRWSIAAAVLAMIFVMIIKRKHDFYTFMAPSIGGLAAGASVSLIFVATRLPIAWLVFATVGTLAAVSTRAIIFDLENHARN